MLQDKKEPIRVLEESLEAAKKEIKESNLKQVYAFFSKKNNEACAYVMEALVGLFRGTKRADMKSVELYT